MKIAIHQPDYIPYLGYFYKAAHSDLFVFLDDVQFTSMRMHNWNNIKTPNGALRLKIPVEYEHVKTPIHQIRTKDELNWKSKHLKSIELNYAKAKYFKDIFPVFRELLLSSYPNLAEMNIAINTFLCERFGIAIKYIRSSGLHIQTSKEQRILDICKSLNGTQYLSGIGAKNYQDEEPFRQNGIALIYSDYHPFAYPQLWKDFIPNLSVLDYIFNCGFDWQLIEKSTQTRKEGL